MELYSSKEYLEEFGGYDMQECALRMRDINGEIGSLEHEVEENIQKFHDAGLKVNCWTVDKKEVAEALVAMGVDYISTNILE